MGGQMHKMCSLFINHTNHPHTKWQKEQLAAAERFGVIQELPFPQIGADWDEQHVREVAEMQANKIVALEPAAVLCQGEFSYTYYLVNLLKKKEITVLSACSERIVKEWVDTDGTCKKIACFQFVRFREY